MSAIKISEHVYSVGVLNPNLRVFDIVMATEFGTSYNSYLIKGEGASALVETVHLDFLDNYLENLKEVLDLNEIEYLIMNHNEPDHSGSVEKLSRLLPNLKIVVSQAGSLYLKNITNRSDLNIIIAKDGDTLEFGGHTLRFVNAPFLHWPDSMFTYLESDEGVFTCDFLGSHFCEPRMLDTKILGFYQEHYFSALKGYYDAIFGPFAGYVRQGLDKLSGLSYRMAATSHGPVLTKDGLLPKVLELYGEWSRVEESSHKRIPVFYCSAYHNTEKLAEAIALGIREAHPDAEVGCYDIIQHDLATLADLLNQSTGFAIGTPTLNRDAVPPVWNLLACIDAVNIQKRPAAVFGSYGWSGEGCKNVRQRLESLRLNVYPEDFRVIFVPSEEDLKNAKEYGKKFAETL